MVFYGKGIPDEKGEPDCPVCLSRVENRAYTNTCLHEFCFPCIEEWSRSHNRCPVCREVYQKILHNIRSKLDYDEQDVLFDPRHTHQATTFWFEDFGNVFTPNDTGVFIVDLRPTRYRLFYYIEYLPRGQLMVIPYADSPILMILRPEELMFHLDDITSAVPIRHTGPHPSWLRHNLHNRR